MSEALEFIKQRAESGDTKAQTKIEQMASDMGFKPKPIEKKVEVIEDEDPEFDKRRFGILALTSLVSLIILFVSFSYAKVFFGVTMGFSFISIGLLAYERIDAFFLKGDSIGKMARNGIASAIFFIGIIYLFTEGQKFGENWLGDSGQVPITEERIDTSPPAYSDTLDVPGSKREADREQ